MSPLTFTTLYDRTRFEIVQGGIKEKILFSLYCRVQRPVLQEVIQGYAKQSRTQLDISAHWAYAIQAVLYSCY